MIKRNTSFMDTENFKKEWPELKQEIQKENPYLTAEELVYKIGEERELLLHLQKKVHKNRKKIDYWLSILG